MKKTLSHTVRTLLGSLSELDFTRMIRAKRMQSKLNTLAEHLALLQNQVREKKEEIDRLDRKIHKLLKFSMKKRSPRRNKETLDVALLNTLETSRRPLGLTELARTLLDTGYRTLSAFGNFRTSVAHTLKKLRPRIARTEDGYSIKSRKRPPQPTRKSKSNSRSNDKSAPKAELQPAGAPP